MLQTGDIREELQAAFPHADLHSIDCDCIGCRITDPMTARRERIVRVQAAVLGAAIVALYIVALFLAPQILAALRSQPSQIEISSPATVGVAGPATRSHR
jgi:hypothetical protein